MHSSVSVVIPAFNVAPWLRQTVNSVLAQTHQPAEVIIVDDGSSDETPEVAKSFGSSVTYIRQANAGVGAARNTGFRHSSGNYIAFVDADDLWLPDKLERQIDLLDSNPHLGWVYCDAFVVDSTDTKVLDRIGRTAELPEGDIVRDLLLRNFIACPTPVIRRALFEKLGGFNEDRAITVAADWDMWLRLAVAADVGCVRAVLARVRSHPQSMTGTMNLESTYKGKVQVIDQIVAIRPHELARLRGRAVANVRVGMGEWMIRRGEREEARKMFASALKSHLGWRAAWLLFGTFLPKRHLDWALRFRRQLVQSGVAVR